VYERAYGPDHPNTAIARAARDRLAEEDQGERWG
jgi:hypothetical protein